MTLAYAGSDDRLAGSQICEVPATYLLARNCRPRSLVKVTVFGKTYLCVVYPHRYKSDVAYIDRTVELNGSNTTANTNDVRIDLLGQCQPADSVEVAVVLKSVHELIKWHEGRRERLAHWLTKILRNYYVTTGSKFFCPSNRPLARLCAIHAIVIEQVYPKEDACRITGNTKITVSNVTYKSDVYDSVLFSNVWEQALGEPTELLAKLCTYPHKYPETLKSVGLRLQSGILLAGPPGTGKTSVVRRVAQKCGAHLLSVRGPELCRSAPGDSEALLRSVFAKAAALNRVLPCIVLIDDVDLLCVRRGSSSSQHANRLVTQLLTLMDGSVDRRRVFVVATTTRPNNIDPAMRRPGRFDRELLMGALSTEERSCILRTAGTKLGLDLSHLVLPTSGFVLGDMMVLLRESLMAAVKRTSSGHTETFVTDKDFQAALATVRSNLSSRLEFAVEMAPRFSWKELGGIANIQKKLQTAVKGPLLNPAAFGRLGVSQPRGVLLVGPPGCGKTAIALALAASCPGLTLFSLGAANVYSPFVGDSEKVISAVFRQARLRAPSAIFMDDIDTLVGRRSGEHSGAQDRVLSALLCEIDGIGSGALQRGGSSEGWLNVVMIATTCKPDAVDDALLRPGRFDLIVYIPPPDAKAREEILNARCAKMSLGEVDLASLAKRLEHFSAADIMHLCQAAGLQAMNELGFKALHVEQRHFEYALSSIFPSLSPEQLEAFERQCIQFCPVT
ncbi:uncharacterized protein LOC144126144 [Amblyomma americanum]